MESVSAIKPALPLGAGHVLAGAFSSLIANRLGAPLLPVFLMAGTLAGEDGLRELDAFFVPSPD